MNKRRREATSIQPDALTSALLPVASALLRSDQGAGILLHATKIAFIQAAILKMQSDKVRPSISSISVVTGMTRKEVAALLKASRSKEPRTLPDNRLEHRALRVLQGWKNDPRYCALSQPRELQIKGTGRTFTSLVRDFGGDVPTVAVLRELERMKAVRRTRSDRLRLVARQASHGAGSSERFAEFARLLTDFSETASQILSEHGRGIYFGFKEIPALEDRQATRFKESFSRRAAALLEGVEHWGVSSGKLKKGTKMRVSGSRRVGLGVYLVDCEK